MEACKCDVGFNIEADRVIFTVVGGMGGGEDGLLDQVGARPEVDKKTKKSSSSTSPDFRFPVPIDFFICVKLYFWLLLLLL